MSETLRSREEIPQEYKWRLEDIFASDQDWETMFSETEKMIGLSAKYQGQLAGGADIFVECMEWADRFSLNLEDLFTYARMRRDEDNRISRYQGMTDRATMLSVQAGSALSFIVPEILAIPDERLSEIRSDVRLQVYHHYLENILRQKQHVLSLAEEKILAETGELASAPSTIFSMANDADLKIGPIEDEEGREIELTKGNFIRYMESKDRRVRQDAFTTLYAAYGKQINSWAAMLGASVKADVFYARVRHYDSAIQSALDDDKVPLPVYDALIQTVHDYLPQFQRYIQLRKKVLGVAELHMYDIYVPFVPEMDAHIPFEEAKSIVREGLKPLGEEYLEILDEGFRSGWIDIYENIGKTSGGYSWGTYSSHPYVLLNHQNTLDSLFTLAHEMGHSLHTYLSNKNQTHLYAGYKIFVAEVASTLNESLVMRHMINASSDNKMKAYLINHYLEQFRGTVFRQTMFAEFEKEIHAAAERNESLTADYLSKIYRDLNLKYFGPDIVLDEQINIEWTRIPHFYNAFYVYKYATGFSAATALAQQIVREGEPAVQRYLAFLSSGGSDYPIELLRQAGVDMEKPEPVKQALDVFVELLDQLEKLVGE
ncbi:MULTISPECIES: oligoendopeptidase F [unclassified Dehalobacter]|uniref:oligoendopeptidase F n=1 Tax=unclassified Dehalobacter TaxID=2635733 RepID=UPI000E6B776A|nr:MULTISPECIES: oligoendopeptidase F [unclassified Dehalobacter]RJE48329.1 oligoendopeptidase F [Dehalobacter sp. MCB1]TCX50398.1 oligoendopeptidase F [Dehalobacter sp. 14DCB1]TCX52362.1 oligoendopeptidase F [Dehalobacter sp. 12DCB1]